MGEQTQVRSNGATETEVKAYLSGENPIRAESRRNGLCEDAS
jgi:hypothetical protein